MRHAQVLLSLLLLSLSLLSCSRRAESLFDYFPDRKGTSRQYQILVDGFQRGFVRIETSSIMREQDQLGLLLTDPRRANLLGRESLLVTQEALFLELPDKNLKLALVEWPPAIGGEWYEVRSGVLARCVESASVQVTAGTFDDVLQMHYRLTPGFMLEHGFDVSDTLDVRLWLAPHEGPVKLQVGEHTLEELVERW